MNAWGATGEEACDRPLVSSTKNHRMCNQWGDGRDSTTNNSS
jgi:hypothetical protein